MSHIFCSDKDYSDIDEVDATHTNVVAIEVVEGGWEIFTDARDWEIWMGQK
jgi:hypothetical protein